MIWTAGKLEQFISESDKLGGPDSQQCKEFWSEFEYTPSYIVDYDLDPFGEDYVCEQLKLYEEISGHPYNVHIDEKSTIDIASHLAAPNPYNHPDPSGLATHLQRLSRVFRYAKVARGGILLDMGCGWGLSSEVAAYLGLTVRAIDVNLDFVELVNRRASAGGRAISATLSAFEDFSLEEAADIALFYECFHHAVRPWAVLDRVRDNLKDRGRVAFAGEPINSAWWPHWGLRLDALSIYCIRKFGWFESGWSLEFLQNMLLRTGFVPVVYTDADPEIGPVIIGTKNPESGLMRAQDAFPMMEVAAATKEFNRIIADNGYLILSGGGAMSLRCPVSTTCVHFNFSIFRQVPLRVTFRAGGQTLLEGYYGSGQHVVQIDNLGSDKVIPIEFDVEQWSPHEELGSADSRRLGIHLNEIVFKK